MAKKEKIVLLGGTGYIGSHFRSYFEKRDLTCLCLRRVDVNPLDPYRLLQTLRDFQPTFLINAAGYTGKPNVDACEDEKNECYMLNVNLVLSIKAACQEMNLPWGHVSSGCIYTRNPTAPKSFRESDPPNFNFIHHNCSFYSGTKALAEQLLEGAHNCYIWRPRMPFDEHAHPKNLLTKLLAYPKLLNVENSLSHLGDFVKACWETRERSLPCGIYNMTNHGSIRTEEIIEMFARLGKTRNPYSYFESDEAFLKTVRSPRSNCTLNTDKLSRYGIKMRTIREALEESIRLYPA